MAETIFLSVLFIALPSKIILTYALVHYKLAYILKNLPAYILLTGVYAFFQHAYTLTAHEILHIIRMQRTSLLAVCPVDCHGFF